MKQIYTVSNNLQQILYKQQKNWANKSKIIIKLALLSSNYKFYQDITSILNCYSMRSNKKIEPDSEGEEPNFPPP